MKASLWKRIGATVLGLALLAALALPVGAEEKAAPEGKTIDVALCLDVSGSMRGLIDSAKAKLWDIVNDLAKAKPAPKLRVTLYSYGHTTYDPKTGWVRKEADFTTDLDMVYQKLTALTINGGEEYVARVCKAAIEEQKWSDGTALKLVFVAGNEPADQDKQVALKDVAEKAVRQGIIINTIYCGNVANAESKAWKEFADLAEGRFASIDQQRGTVAISTPVDKELTELGSKLNLTFCFAGKEAKNLADNQRRQDANAAAQAPGVAAARAATKGGDLYRFEDDLVEKLKRDPKFDVKKVAAEDLPDELKKMTPEEREKHIKDLLAKREDLQKKIAELNKKREEYIKEELKKNPNAADKAFDEAVRGAIRDQAKKKGIEIPD